MAKKIIFCKCESVAKYRFAGEAICGNCLLSQFRDLLSKGFVDSDTVEISMSVELLGWNKCLKKPDCGYWDYGCILDKCVLEK